MFMKLKFVLSILFLGVLWRCAPSPESQQEETGASFGEVTEEADIVKANLDKYATVPLTTDAQLTDKEKQMIPVLIQAAQLMDDILTPIPIELLPNSK